MPLTLYTFGIAHWHCTQFLHVEAGAALAVFLFSAAGSHIEHDYLLKHLRAGFSDTGSTTMTVLASRVATVSVSEYYIKGEREISLE